MAQKKSGKFVAQVGNKKIAPVDMKKEEHQYVIDGYLVDEVLKEIPAGIDILQAKVKIWVAGKNVRVIVPNVLKKLGIEKMREHKEGKEAEFVFDQIAKSTLQKNVQEGCKKLGLPYEQAYFQYVILSNGKGTGRFTHTRKEVKPDETDLRKKLRVLGITSGVGQVQNLITELGAKKYYCTIKEEAVKFVMCQREK